MHTYDTTDRINIERQREQNRSRAIGQFIGRKIAIDDLLRDLMDASDHHFGRDPDEINFADVGSLAEVESKLREIVEFLNIKR